MKGNLLVRPLRIELSSLALQTTAMTTLAQDALLVHRDGFEPPSSFL
jgi:hypothetical protein